MAEGNNNRRGRDILPQNNHFFIISISLYIFNPADRVYLEIGISIVKRAYITFDVWIWNADVVKSKQKVILTLMQECCCLRDRWYTQIYP